MDIEVNQKDFKKLQDFIKQILRYAKSNQMTKEKMIHVIENCFEDKTCPLSWDNAIIIRTKKVNIS